MTKKHTKKGYFENSSTIENDKKRRQRTRQNLQPFIDQLAEYADTYNIMIERIIFVPKNDQNKFVLNKHAFKDKKENQIFKKEKIAFKCQKARDLCNISEKNTF